MSMGSTSQIPNDHLDRGYHDAALSGIVWFGSGIVAQTTLRMLVLVVLARLVTPESFGLVGAALIVIGFASIFSRLGLGAAIVQRELLEPRHVSVAFTLSLVLGLAFAGLMWVLAPFIASFFRMDELESVLYILAMLFPIQALSVVSGGLLQRAMRFRNLALVEFLSYAVGFAAIGIPLALLDFGVWALVWASIGQMMFRGSTMIAMTRHPIRPSVDFKALKELLSFGNGLTGVYLVNYIASHGADLVVGRWLGAAALGVYSRAYQISLMPALVFGSAADKVLFPIMSRIQLDSERLAAAYRRSAMIMALLTLPSAALLIVVAPEVVHLMLGEQWSAVVLPFQILVIALLSRGIGKLSDSVARAKGAVYQQALRHAIYALLVIAGAGFGQRWGLPGVATGIALAITIHSLLMSHLTLLLTGLPVRELLRAHVPGLATALVVGGLTWTIASISRALAVPDLMLLIAVVMMVTPVILFLWRWHPRLFLGSDGLWMIRLTTERLPVQAGSLVKTLLKI